MLSWMIYVGIVTSLLSCAAFAAERTARLRRAPTRWIWLAAILASLLLPTIVSSVSIQIPNFFTPVVSQSPISLRDTTSAQLSPTLWVQRGIGQVPKWRSADSLLKQAWKAVSIAMILALALTGFHLFLRKRHWKKQILVGKEIYLTDNIGPAVVGLLQPRIVIPEWILQSPDEHQKMVMAHEQSHVDANDPQLLTIALCLLIAMPWNLPLWWQLHRLRYAIEVDCDTRVLQAGGNVQQYGGALIEVGQRQSAFIGAVAAMSESKSFLEQRIELMVQKPTRWSGSIALGLLVIAITFGSVAAQISPPNSTASTKIDIDNQQLASSDLDKYLGYYKMFGLVLTVARNQSQLTAQLTGQEAGEIFAESDTTFFAKINDAKFTFSADANGRINAVTLNQKGQQFLAPRIEADLAHKMEREILDRKKQQQQNPASEAALRRMVASILSGKPNYTEMSPDLAQATEKQLPRFLVGLQKLGAIQSISFIGVDAQGWDAYVMRHENGMLRCSISLDERGIVVGALFY